MRRVFLKVVFPMLFAIFLIISYNSSYIVSFLNFIEVTYMTNQLAMINRTSLFLFFNAILLFVARDSGLLLAPSPGSDVRSPLPRTDELVEVKAIVVVVEEEEEAEVEISATPCLELESDQELVEDVEVEAIKEVDELNRRCEEFIEKFKRERLIEAKQPPGMVVC